MIAVRANRINPANEIMHKRERIAFVRGSFDSFNQMDDNGSGIGTLSEFIHRPLGERIVLRL